MKYHSLGVLSALTESDKETVLEKVMRVVHTLLPVEMIVQSLPMLEQPATAETSLLGILR
jgi:hypothetical protein